MASSGDPQRTGSGGTGESGNTVIHPFDLHGRSSTEQA